MKERRKDRKLEKAARTNTLNVDLEAVKSEHEASGGLFQDIRKAAEIYGIYEDLFDHAYFNPVVNLIIEYDYQDDIITPVLRGTYLNFVLISQNFYVFVNILISRNFSR